MKNLLIYRFTLFNGVMASGLAYLWASGAVASVFANDQTYITLIIAALFVATWCATAQRIWSTSSGLNNLKGGGVGSATHAMSSKDSEKAAWLGQMSDWLAGLGLIGTVIGFAIALSAVDHNTLSDANGVQGSVETLMRGMRIALNTTIAGAIASMWTEINFRILKTGLSTYWHDRMISNGL